VLIEKTRTAVTDGTGQYRITDLPPGTYRLTFLRSRDSPRSSVDGVACPGSASSR
jgi:hypothetical protein